MNDLLYFVGNARIVKEKIEDLKTNDISYSINLDFK